MDAVVHQSGPACVIAGYGPIAISLWRGAVNVADLDATARFADGVRAQHPAAHLSLSVATIFVKPPDDATKKRILELRASSANPGFQGSIVVLAGDGFWASVMRSLLAGLNLVGGNPNEQHVRTLAEAAALAHERIPSVDAADLARALDKLTADAGIRCS